MQSYSLLFAIPKVYAEPGEQKPNLEIRSTFSKVIASCNHHFDVVLTVLLQILANLAAYDNATINSDECTLCQSTV